MTHLKAVEAGATIIDTCVGAFAEGASHPTTQSLVAALAGTEYDTGLSLPLIEEISAYFKEVRKKYWQFESAFTGTDTRVLINQVPGGMISNLANQLKEQGALDKMDAVLDEIPRVREDLGYPPLVTPTSQIVGTQAALNVMTGARYKSVTNEVKLYLQGRYGKAPGHINEEVRKIAIGDLDVTTCRPADLLADELDKLRGEIEGLAKSDEDVLTYAMFPEIGKTWLQERAAGSLKPEQLLPPGHFAAGQRAALRRRRIQDHAARRDLPYQAVRQWPLRRYPAPLFRVDRWRHRRGAGRTAERSCSLRRRRQSHAQEPAQRRRRPRPETPRPATPATSPRPCPAPSSTCWSASARRSRPATACW